MTGVRIAETVIVVGASGMIVYFLYGMYKDSKRAAAIKEYTLNSQLHPEYYSIPTGGIFDAVRNAHAGTNLNNVPDADTGGL